MTTNLHEILFEFYNYSIVGLEKHSSLSFPAIRITPFRSVQASHAWMEELNMVNIGNIRYPTEIGSSPEYDSWVVPK